MPAKGPRRPLRILVLGCGSVGRWHIQNLLTLQAGEITAFDPLPERRQQVRADLGIAIADSLEQAWELEPHLVVIAASTQEHVPLAREAAARGCHLFIEKPLSHALDGLADLCAAVEERQLVTMVGCNMRFHPGPATVKRLLESDCIGPVIAARIQTGSYLPRWRPQQDYRQSYSASPEWGGAILDCIHEIDLALWYLGPAQVIAAAHLLAHTIGLETEGLAEILLRHESGALSSVHLNFIQRDYRRTCQVIGSRGTIDWSWSDHQVRVYNEEGQVQQTYQEPAGWPINQMYLEEIAHLLAAVDQGQATVNPLVGGIAALRVALAARQMGRGRSG